MPWTVDQVESHIKGLDDKQKERWVAVANSALAKCEKEGGEDCDASAIKQANAAVSQTTKATELLTVDIPGVEILATGHWKGHPREIDVTGDILDQIVAAFEEMSKGTNYEPPLKLGHDDTQALLQADGYPAAGYVKALRRFGDKLLADFVRIPSKIGDIIKAGGYKKVSSEVQPNYESQGKTHPWVLKAVSLLGADIPAVKSIGDIVAQYKAGDDPVIVFYEQPEAVQEATPEINKEEVMEKELRELLGLDEKADILVIVKDLKAKADSATQLSEQEAQVESRLKETEDKVKVLETSLAESNQKIALKERDERVSSAVREGKLTPAMRDKWGNDLALKDPARFAEIIGSLPKAVDTTEHGTQGGNPEEVQLTETELKVADKLGISKEDLLKSKAKKK